MSKIATAVASCNDAAPSATPAANYHAVVTTARQWPGYHGSVLATDLELIDFDGRCVSNWFHLLAPAPIAGGGCLALVFTEAQELVHVALTGTGAIELTEVPWGGTSAPALAALRRTLGCDAVLVLDREALGRVHAEVDGQLALADDYVAQCLAILRGLKRLSGRGIWSDPPLLELLPTPPADALQRTFDLLIPNDASLVAYVFEDGGTGVHASAILGKHGGSIDFVTSHLGLEQSLPAATLARDWRQRYRRCNELVAARYDRPVLSIFLERSTYYRILTGPTDQLARELAGRNLIIDPAPAWLLGLLGGATMAAFATRGAKALARVIPASARKMASGAMRSAQTAMKDSGAHPFALLGFDPIELWLRLRHFYGGAAAS